MPTGYVFGPFVVDLVKRRLWRDGRFVAINSKTFDVLVVLIHHRDHIVSKEELLDRVWPNISVNENNLARQISSLRRALGQRPDQHDFLVTVPGQGYRFVAPVKDVQDVQDLQDLSDIPMDLSTSQNLDSPEPSEQSAPSETYTSAEAPGPAAPVPTDRWSVAGVFAAIGCGLLAIVAAATVPRRADPTPHPQRTLQRITYDEAALPRDASWSPDGQWVVYTSDRAGNADLWKQRPGDPDPIRLTTSGTNESQPHWSPDGRSIVFRSERDGGGLYVIPADGGDARIVSTFGYDPAWSPDGTHILFQRTVVLPALPTIYVVGLDGRPPRPVRPDVLGQFSSLHAAWHPDGRRISIWGLSGEDDMRFVTVPLDGGSPTVHQISARVQQAFAGVSASGFVWAPSGRHIYFEGSTGDTKNVWRVTVDPLTGAWVAGPERLTTGAGQESHVAISPDGTRVTFTTTSSRTRLWAFPLDQANGGVTGQPFPISSGSAGEVDFDVRADGSKVAYRAVRAGRNELWERSMTDGQERLLLSSTDARLMKPRWSPDGTRVAFSRCASRGHAIAASVVNVDGSGERVVTTSARLELLASDWSKDGQAILGACRFSKSERYATCLVPVSNPDQGADPPVHVIASDPKRNLYNQRFSPDQRWITFLAHDLLYASNSTIYVTSTAGGPWQAITDGGWFDDKPRWSRDGRILYFVSNRSGIANVWGRRFDPSTGTPVGDPFPVTSFRSAQFQLTPRTVQMDIALTATHLLLPMSESRSDIWMLSQVDR